MKTTSIFLAFVTMAAIFMSCEKENSELLVKEPNTIEKSSSLKSASAIADGSYQVDVIIDPDPLWKFHISGNSVTLETDPSVTSWGSDYWGIWSDPYELKGDSVSYITGGLTQTTYYFNTLSDGSIAVSKHVIRGSYLGGAEEQTHTEPGIYTYIGEDDSPSPNEPTDTTQNENTAPLANIIVSATQGRVPLQVTFDGSASSDAEGDALTYSWVFGDGGISTGETTMHTYTAEGVYTATLTVDDGALSSTAEVTITVEAEPAPTFCENPVTATLPLKIRGKGTYCYEVSGNISQVKSRGLSKLIINGIDYTNERTTNLPDAIDGKYYIEYEGTHRKKSYFEAR